MSGGSSRNAGSQSPQPFSAWSGWWLFQVCPHRSMVFGYCFLQRSCQLSSTKLWPSWDQVSVRDPIGRHALYGTRLPSIHGRTYVLEVNVGSRCGCGGFLAARIGRASLDGGEQSDLCLKGAREVECPRQWCFITWVADAPAESVGSAHVRSGRRHRFSRTGQCLRRHRCFRH